VGQELRTSLTGRLGEWISLGGSDESKEQENRQLLGKGMRSQTQANQVWIKVEVIE
jgi:hypothetical protein